MPDPSEIERLQRAKERLRQEVEKRPWFRGVGIAPSETGLKLRLNVDQDCVHGDELPREFDGFSVDIVFIKGYEPR